MSITSYNGGLGSGKTFRMTINLYNKYLEGKKVLANYNLHFPFTKINPSDLINGLFDDRLDDCEVGLTEAYTFLDSRFSGSEASRYQSYFLLQTRKRKISINYDAQMIESVDVRLRGITNRIYECKKVLKDSNKDREDINNILGFMYHVTEDNGNEWDEVFPIETLKEWFKLNLYDTHDILLPAYLMPIPDINTVIDTFESFGDNRETFLTMIRIKAPFITYDKARAVYALMKNDKLKEVKEMLRIR